MNSCISYYSYIKPQLLHCRLAPLVVVYRTIPTSNHNLSCIRPHITALYIVLFLHQTTTVYNCDPYADCCISYYSYIKPQQYFNLLFIIFCCISYYSYIKPQPSCAGLHFVSGCISYYSYIKPQLVFTSN